MAAVSNSLLLFFIFAGQVSAAYTDEWIEEIVVTPMLNKQAGMVVDHISRWEVGEDLISLQNPINTLDLLRQAPGLSVTQQGGPGGLSFVSIRGGDPNFTKVMIDGVDVDNPTNSRGGGFDFSLLGTGSVDSVEVLYGPYSALYGSSGLSGVVNIVTKRPSEQATGSLGFEVGENNARAGTLIFSGPLDNNIGGTVSLSGRKTGETVEGSELDRQQLIFKLSTLGQSDIQFSVGGLFARSDAHTFPEDSGGDQLAVIRKLESRDIQQANIYATSSLQLNSRWHTDVFVSRSELKEESDNPGIASGVFNGIPEIKSDTDYVKYELRWGNSVKLIDDVLYAAMGLNGLKEKADNQSRVDFGFPLDAGFSMDRETYGVSLELQAKVSELDFLVGYRWDDADGNSEGTGRFVMGYQPEWSSAKLTYSYAEGFKLPSIFALAHPLIGNTALQPELSKSHEVRLNYPFSESTSLSLLAYRTKYFDLIDFDPTLFTNVNRSNVLVRGGQAELKIQLLCQAWMRLHASYTDSEVVGESVELRRRPEWQGGGTLFWQFGDSYKLSMTYESRSKFVDSSIPTGVVSLGGYNQFNLFAEWQVSKASAIGLAVNNIFDDEFEEAVGFSNPGREIRVSFKSSLNF